MVDRRHHEFRIRLYVAQNRMLRLLHPRAVGPNKPSEFRRLRSGVVQLKAFFLCREIGLTFTHNLAAVERLVAASPLDGVSDTRTDTSGVGQFTASTGDVQ